MIRFYCWGEINARFVTMRLLFRTILSLAGLAFFCTTVSAQTPAKRLFGNKRLPAAMKPQVHGFYSKGCVSGAVAIPATGPTWQAMRLSRNRRWGHPELVKLVINISQKAKKTGWNGLMVGDLSQPRGGPMLTGHASHQIGLDADIWLNEMPDRVLSHKERETISARSMLSRTAKGKLNQNKIGPNFSVKTLRLIKAAAEFGQVQRILVHPTIKRELCRMATGDRKWLYKVRPYWRHHYHMHVRMSCPADSPGCRPQAPTRADDGCGKELKTWARLLNPPKPKKSKKPKKPKKPVKKVKPRKPKPELTLAALPKACTTVLNSLGPASESAATVSFAGSAVTSPVLKAVANAIITPSYVTKPTPRPAQ